MKTFSIILLLALTLSSIKAQFTDHGVDANWSQKPKVVATITGQISKTNNVAGAVPNNMIVKQNGTVIIFYKHNNQNKWMQSSDNGNTWTSPGTLPSAAANGLSTISADIDQNDNIYIVWKSGNFSLGFAKFNGSSWSPVYTINTQTKNAGDTIGFSQITTDRKNRIHIMWQQGNHHNYTGSFYSTCWYARSTDGGETFTTMQLSQNNQNNHHAAFPVADFGGTSHDTLMIAWRENVNGCSSTLPSQCSSNGWNWDVKARITYDGGATWNPVITIEGSGANDDDDDQWDPNVVVDKNGVIHTFYHIYHNNAMPDYNAKIMYEYSINGGKDWSKPQQLSTPGIRSHLIKTAYDFTNNFVWCTWKDEMDFGKSKFNPQADLKAVYIQYTGTPIISSQEFITDYDTSEVALHNLKVGKDGILRATYNLSKLEGKGDTIFYQQRNVLITGLKETSLNKHIKLYPNPTTELIYIDIDNTASDTGYTIKLINTFGQVIEKRYNDFSPLKLPESGTYFIEISNGEEIWHQKIIKF